MIVSKQSLLIGAVAGAIAVPVLAGGPIVPQARMGEPVHGLTPGQLALFLQGQTDYNTPLLAEDGLGPVFNKESCGNCHNNPLGGTGSQTVTRFGLADKGSFDPLDIFGGSLLQAQAINEDCAEVVPALANVTAMRVTNGMMGYGLVEAIPDSQILALVGSPPGVSGAVQMVEAFEAPGVMRAGRFGWKAQVPTLLTFSADAAQNEMGLTNRFIPTENDPNGINPPELIDCDLVADPEDGPDGAGLDFIDRVAAFQRYLAAPPQTPRSGMTGEAIFDAIGCSACHVAAFTTSNAKGLEDALAGKSIRPYSDFLLHDMGLAADFIPQGTATERELKTPPLWGVRVRDPLWHDGRFGGDTFANRITLAIEEHGVFGSEGIDSFNAWDALSSGDKDAVIAFLDSLGRGEFDVDGDHAILLEDFQDFAACYGGGPYTADDACAIHDIDQDGDVDDDDYASFLLVWEGATTDCNANGILDITDILHGTSLDLDGDGMPDECCFADVDQDGSVGFNDLVTLLASWGPCQDCPADLDDDEMVGFSDLVALLAAWGPCAP